MNKKQLLEVYIYNLSQVILAFEHSMAIPIEAGDKIMVGYMLMAIQPMKFLMENCMEQLKKEMAENPEGDAETAQKSLSDLVEESETGHVIVQPVEEETQPEEKDPLADFWAAYDVGGTQ